MATASTSISGLASGLDTASIISQLMQVEALPQSRLKTKVSAEQSTVKSLQDLNAKIAALATKAGDLAKTTGWSPMTVSSSSDLVTATAGTGAAPGTVSFTFNQYAVAHRLSATNTAALTDVVTTGSNTVRLDYLDGTTKDVDTGDGSLNGLVSALNAAGTGVRATTIKLDDGSYRLQVTSATSGAASDFTLKNLDGSDLLGGSTVTTGQDAAITVGADTLHSTTNTFAGVVSGLDITLKPGLTAGTAVDLTVAQDPDTLTKSVKSLVDDLNAALTSLDALTSYNSTTKASGALTGDAAVRTLRNSILSAVYPGDGTSLADVGVQVDRYGKLTFDEARFKTAYAADPAAVSAKFTTGTVDGFAARVQTLAKQASDPIDGTITTTISGRKVGIDRMQESIESWDARLELRRSHLTRQFTALETALSQLQSQGDWLSGQLASLSGS